MSTGVVFVALPDPADPAPVVGAEIAGELVCWLAEEATWRCTCSYVRPNRKADPQCSHVLAVARAMPVPVANHLARALIASGRGTASTRRDALLAPAATN